MVYGTGAEEDTGALYLYGFVLHTDERGEGGSVVLRKEIGQAPFRETATDLMGNTIIRIPDYRLDAGELYDGGNNLLVNDDGSLIISGSRSLVRIVP